MLSHLCAPYSGIFLSCSFPIAKCRTTSPDDSSSTVKVSSPAQGYWFAPLTYVDNSVVISTSIIGAIAAGATVHAVTEPGAALQPYS